MIEKRNKWLLCNYGTISLSMCTQANPQCNHSMLTSPDASLHVPMCRAASAGGALPAVLADLCSRATQPMHIWSVSLEVADPIQSACARAGCHPLREQAPRLGYVVLPAAPLGHLLHAGLLRGTLRARAQLRQERRVWPGAVAVLQRHLTCVRTGTWDLQELMSIFVSQARNHARATVCAPCALLEKLQCSVAKPTRFCSAASQQGEVACMLRSPLPHPWGGALWALRAPRAAGCWW